LGVYSLPLVGVYNGDDATIPDVSLGVAGQVSEE
jgi:hypothetical protein